MVFPAWARCRRLPVRLGFGRRPPCVRRFGVRRRFFRRSGRRAESLRSAPRFGFCRASAHCCMKGSLACSALRQPCGSRAGRGRFGDQRAGFGAAAAGARGGRCAFAGSSLVGAGLAERDRHGDERDQEDRDQRQQVPFLEVVVEVVERSPGPSAPSSFSSGPFFRKFIGAAHRLPRACFRSVLPAASVVTGAGAVGGAPAVSPWPGGVR